MIFRWSMKHVTMRPASLSHCLDLQKKKRKKKDFLTRVQYWEAWRELFEQSRGIQLKCVVLWKHPGFGATDPGSPQRHLGWAGAHLVPLGCSQLLPHRSQSLRHLMRWRAKETTLLSTLIRNLRVYQLVTQLHFNRHCGYSMLYVIAKLYR